MMEALPKAGRQVAPPLFEGGERMSYSKLFASIVHSSLWTAPDHVRLLFVTLLAIADPEGFVFGSRPGLERAANIHYDPEAGDPDPWEVLLSPDPHSSDRLRNPENEGRRIEEIPGGGFRILNFLYYRSLRDAEARRDQNRNAQARFRARNKSKKSKTKETKQASADVNHSKPASATVSHSKPISEAEADVRVSFQETRVDLSSNWLTQDDVWLELQRILPEKEINERIGLWINRIKENRPALYEAICDFKDKRNQRSIRNPAAWLTQRYLHFKHLAA
jgi:hypothetical protein